ncbi:RES family NAD+ phosphorylase [Paraburkholderia sp. MM6662-R1]|uniref:RES family NAD+ phosphorylase n=1 Tax=Paraburkholderia sp. MM6662-R1 TaxID=2991066 RepID=UPI003D255F3E
MPDHICYECFDDEHLREMVRREGAIDECRVCEEQREGVSAERLGQILAPVMRDCLRLGDSVPDFGNDGRLYHRQLGDSLSHWVQEFLGQYFDFEREIVDAIVATDNWDLRGGEEPFWDDMQNYERVEYHAGDYHDRWKETLADVKHRRRFFSEKARQFFTELFDGVEDMYVPGKRRAPVVRSLSAGKRLFRARVVTSASKLQEMLDDPLKHIGPPPPADARAGRMNAEGVSVFYGSRKEKTCLAEMRPAIGNDIALIELKTTRKLRVLDFSRLDEARSSRNLSCFQPDFQAESARRLFLRLLHALIAQPITPGRESDYLITQTMAEFLSHVTKPSFDGIMFQSAQQRGGTNVVLFPNAMANQAGEPQDLPLALTDGQVRLYTTQSIAYYHEQKHFYRAPDSDEFIPIGEVDQHRQIDIVDPFKGEF